MPAFNSAIGINHLIMMSVNNEKRTNSLLVVLFLLFTIISACPFFIIYNHLALVCT